MRQDDADVIICGAGIAGLGLACALSAYDLKILLVEKRRGAGGIHRGDSLLPRTTRLLASWGALDRVLAADAQRIERLEIHHTKVGKVCEAPLQPANAAFPYLVLPHARFEQVLLDHALSLGRTRLVRPARAVGVVREGATARGLAYEGPSGLTVARARLVVACDGHRSVVRDALGITVDPFRYDHAYLGLEADRPPGYENAMRLHFHEEGGVLLMPRRDRIGIGMLVEAGSSKRWLAMPDDELLREVARRAPIVEGMTLHRDGSHVYELVRAHVPRYVSDGAVVIGDAAHCTNPAAGQGMTMALGDAGLLAEAVGPALAAGEADLGPALAGYETRRWHENDKMIRGSHLLARVYALRGPRWDWLKTRLARVLASPLGGHVIAPVLRAFLAGGGTSGRSSPTPVVSVTPAAAPLPDEVATRDEVIDEAYDDEPVAAAGDRA